MTPDTDRGLTLLTARWLALGAAAGVAVSLALDQFGVQGPWQGTALALALLALFATTTMALTSGKHDDRLREESERSRRGEAEVNALQQEINRHTQLEQELTKAKQAAEAAVMAKGEFLATMSHEIRTPLNGIVPMLDLLQHSRMQPDQMELVKTATASAQQLLRIVDDILDYSKLESEKLELEATGFNLDTGGRIRRVLWVMPGINANVALEVEVRRRDNSLEQTYRWELASYSGRRQSQSPVRPA